MDAKKVFPQIVYMHRCCYGENITNKFIIKMGQSPTIHLGNQAGTEYITYTEKL